MTTFPRHAARAAAAVAVAGLLALGASGCGDDAAAGPAAPATIAAAAPVALPAPSGKAVLTLRGRIGTTNAGRTLALDMATLESLGAQRIELYEPFEKTRMSFRAVPMSAILAAADADPGATTLHSVALNDYVVDIPLDVAGADGVWMATRTGDGKAIPVADGGPIRVVFTDGARGADVDNYWIWSVASGEVR